MILAKPPREMGFLLGLAGLILFTWGFAYTKPNIYWLLTAWAIYPLLGFLFYSTNPKLSLIFGLIFLLYPPIYIASYNSVSSLTLEIVSVQRVFGSSISRSVTLVIGFAISAPLASLPVTISDTTLGVFVANSSDYYHSFGVGNVKAGTLFPYGHLNYQLEVISSDSHAVQAVNDTSTYVALLSCSNVGYVCGIATSLLYSNTPYIHGSAHWDWRTGAAISVP